MTTTHQHPGPAQHTALTGRRITARIRQAAERLSDRIHAAADDRARALGWQVTPTPGPLGLSGRQYRDPRFGDRAGHRRDGTANGERHD